MRICYYADGRYVHAERWMRFFVQKGHEMHLISFAPVSDERAAELERLGIKYHGSTGNFHIKKPWLTFRDLRFIRSVLAKERIEILHSHFLGANAWFGALTGFGNHIITIMGGGDVNGPDWKPDANLQSRFLTPYALRKAAYLTSWSRLMADVVKPLCPGVPIEVIHGGIHLERFAPAPKPRRLLEAWGIPADAKVVFSPRLMRPLSNIVEIARAAQRVSSEVPHVYYLVAFPATAVNSQYNDEVKAAFADGPAADNVRFISEVPHMEISDYFNLADVTVSIPSTDGTPMTVLEAMASGTSTVIGNLPDYDKEYFEDGKTTVMVDVNDPQSIADGILKALTDDKLRSEITAEARRRVGETGSYEHQMSKMEGIYKSLVC